MFSRISNKKRNYFFIVLDDDDDEEEEKYEEKNDKNKSQKNVVTVVQKLELLRGIKKYNLNKNDTTDLIQGKENTEMRLLEY